MSRIVITYKGKEWTFYREEEELEKMLGSLSGAIIRSGDIKSRPLQQEKTKNGTPNTDDLKNFIMRQPNYRHDISMITLHFLNKRIKSYNNPDKHDNYFYTAISKKLDRIRNEIKQKERGDWKDRKKGFGGYKEYFFIKRGTQPTEDSPQGG